MATVIFASEAEVLGESLGFADSDLLLLGEPLGLGAGDNVGVALEFGFGATTA